MKLPLFFIFILTVFFGSILAQNPVYEWANAIGTSTASGARGVSIKADATGNTYITGSFVGALDVDPSGGVFNITSYLSSKDFFIAKYNSTGTLIWAKSIGGPLADECNSIAIDNAGNVLLTGNFQGTVDFDPGVGVNNFTTSGTDIFFEKLDSNGNFIWARSINNNFIKKAYSVTSDQNNNVIITGYFYGVVDFDPGPAFASYTNFSPHDIFYLAKYDANGNYIWSNVAQQYTGKSIGRSLVCDNNNNIFLGGHYSGKVDFDPSSNVDTLSSFSGALDIFFAKYDAGGNLAFVKHATGGASDSLNCITLDANKNILIAGNFPGGSVDFDPSPAVAVPVGSTTSYNIFIAKYDSLGNYLWVFPVGTNAFGGSNDCRSIVTDVSGNIYATGYYTSASDFDPSPTVFNLTSLNSSDAFIAKYDAGGNYIWAKKMVSNQACGGAAIAINNSGNIICTGTFYGVTDFDPSAATYNLFSSVFNAYFKHTFFLGSYTPSGAFVNAFAPQDYQWGDEYSYCIKNDQLGNVFICGAFSGSVDFDPSPIADYYMTSAGQTDGFIAKYSSTGAFIWARKIGGPKSDQCKSLAIDNLGNCLVTGSFDSTATFNAALTATLASNGGHEDVFLMKLNPVGFLLWHTGFGSTGFDCGTSITVDNSNNVYVAGYFEGTVDSDPSAASNIIFSNGAKDIFFSKFAPNGNFIFGKAMGSSTDDMPNSIAIDNFGNLVMIGGFSQTTDFDPGPGFTILNCSGGYDIFLAKYNSTGANVFAYKIGNTGWDIGSSVCVDATNNYLISGNFTGSVDFDPATFSSAILTTVNSNSDGFVAKYDSLGNYQWVKHIFGTLGQTANGVTTDLSSNVYVTGTFYSQTNFSPIVLNSIGQSDQYISKYNSNGNSIWVSQVGGANNNNGISLAVDNSNNIYATGCFSGASDFDPSILTTSLVAAGGTDAFILKYKQCVNVTASITSQSSVSCYGGSNASVGITANGGSGFTYSWSPGGATTASISGLSVGSYSCLVMNSCGSANSINVSVTQPSSLNISSYTNPLLICEGNSISLQTQVSGGTPAYSYTWNTGSNASAITFTATTPINYTCNVSDANGCSITETVSIVVNASPTVNVSASNYTVCAGQLVSLNANGANSYSWSTNNTGNSITINPSSTNVYSVTGQALNGCKNTATLSLVVNPLPILNVMSSQPILCFGDSATISVAGALSYTWSNGNNSNIITVTPTLTTTYSVTGISSLGCIDSTTFTQNVSICTALNDNINKSNSSISIYPNPNNGVFYIGEFENNIGKSVEVYNSLGQLIKELKIESSTPQININEYPNGFYFIRILDKNQVLSIFKIIKE